MHLSSNPTVRIRQAVEARIVKATLRAFFKAGYQAVVFDGGEDHGPFTTVKAAMDKLMETDEDFLHAVKVEHCGEDGMQQVRYGWVRFVYGNDGWDVINDYTCNLEDEGTLKPVLDLIEKLGG